MSDDFNKDTSRYGDYFDYYFNDTDTEKSTKSGRNNRNSNNRGNNNRNSNNRNNSNHNINNRNHNSRNIRKRKGLKWKLLSLLDLIKYLDRKVIGIFLLIVTVLIVIISVIASIGGNSETTEPIATEPETTVYVNPNVYQISGVPLIPQDEYRACCETYAGVMLLQYYNFDIDMAEFVNNYLIVKPVSYGADGTMFGPDMNSAFAGDIYTGYGINAPGMAKCMNNYIKTTKSKLTAYPLKGVSIKDICDEYIRNDIPVMIWATTYMQEPYVEASWVVDYVDENAEYEIGDVMDWQMHEHCLLLIGFDEENYYVCDSAAEKVAAYDKAIFEERYAQIGTQAIVVK